jgi:hypothetical protein
MMEELDLTNEDADALDKGSQLNPGWYPAVLDNVTSDVRNPGTLVFAFVIAGGAFDGVKTSKRLFDPLHSNDTDSAKKLAQQRITWAKRLGLIDSTASGRKVSIDWQAAVGQEVAIKVSERKGQDGILRCEVEWAGVFPRTDERVPALIRNSTVQPAAQQTAGTHTAPPHRPPPAAVDYGSL